MNYLSFSEVCNYTNSSYILLPDYPKDAAFFASNLTSAGRYIFLPYIILL